MSPKELIEGNLPHIKCADQYIETAKWPDQKCACQGRGHYGMLHPKVQAENTLKMSGNYPCVCKSGKKYKKCCRDKVERLAKSGYRILVCRCVGEAFLAENPFVEEMRKELAVQWNLTSLPQSDQSSAGGATSMPTIDPASELNASSQIPVSIPASETPSTT